MWDEDNSNITLVGQSAVISLLTSDINKPNTIDHAIRFITITKRLV